MNNPSLAVIAAVLTLAGAVFAEDRNGLSVTISRKVVVLPAGAAAAEDDSRRVQTLTLAAKNNSIRNLPEGTVEWTVLVRNFSGRAMKYAGTDKLPPLRRIESAEIPLGVINVWNEQIVERDKIDYEVVISHDGKESIRLTNTSSFAMLAEMAKQPEKGEGFFGPRREKHRMKGEDKPAGELEKPREVEKKPREIEKDPAQVARNAPVTETKTVPTATPAAPPEARKTAADLPPAPQPTFDFFNLGGKKNPLAK